MVRHTQTLMNQFYEDRVQKRDWSKYVLATSVEYEYFCKILSRVLDQVIQKKRVKKNGRPKANLRDILFCLILRSYFIRSSYRIISMINELAEKKIIQTAPKRTTFMKYLKDPKITEILEQMVHLSSRPLIDHEKIFAIDASGFSSGMSEDSWVRARYTGKKWTAKGYRKAHICIGVKSGIITAAKITASTVHDTLMFGPLLEKTAESFEVIEVLADKGYHSRKNYKLISDLGAIGYIPFRNNTSGLSKGSPQYGKQYKKYLKHRDVFDRHYHLRSNVEASFSASKRKFGSYVLAKSAHAQNNEVLCKLISHNITIVIHSIIEGTAILKFIDNVSINT